MPESTGFNKENSLHLIRFFLPLLCFNTLEVAFGVIDTIWVGNLLGAGAIGAVSICFTVVLVLNGIAFGMTSAITVLVARFYGGENPQMVTRLVSGSCGFSLFLSLVISVFFLCFCYSLKIGKS